jgi:hypothetical protein
MRVKYRVYKTADGKAVPEGHADATELLFGQGAEVSDADAKKYNLTENGAPGQKADAPITGRNTDPDSPQGKPIAQVEAEAREAAAKAGEGDDSGASDRTATRGAKARK